MTQLLLSIVGGIAVAVLIVVLIVRAARRSAPSEGRSPYGWAAFAMGLLTLVLVVVGYVFAPEYANEAEAQAAAGEFDSQGLYMVGTITGVAAGVLAALALRRGDRRWPTWVGLLVGAGVVGAWVYVIIYVMFNPY